MFATKDDALESEVVTYFTQPSARSDPYPFYKRMRESAPIYYSPTMDVWVASSYEAVNQTVQAQVRYKPRSADDPSMGRARKVLYSAQFLFLDPPAHSRMRDLVKKTLSGTNAEHWRPAIARWIGNIQDDVRNRDQIELVEEVTTPAPFKVICEVIGLPYEDMPKLKQYTRGFLELHSPDVTPEMDAVADQEFDGFCNYLRPLYEQRVSSNSQQNDVFNELIAHQLAGEISFEQIGLLMLLLMVGGHETTAGMFASAIHCLLNDREQWEALVADPALATQAVEETLRFETPARQLQPKLLVVDTIIAGVTVPAGQRVIPFLAAAHRDPSVFADPDRFDIRRNSKLNLAFGFGRHFCIGAAFARVEGQEFLRAFPRTFPNIYPNGPVEWSSNIMLRMLEHLPVRMENRG
jgi:cytochrome P450